MNRDTSDPNLKFVDLNGDGHADVLITEDKALVWHPSLAEQGFGGARRVAQALDEELGPRVVFADGTQSIYLADLSGDGLTDLVRIRNGEVCYWPNLGHGRFGPKITIDNSPRFDVPDKFDQRRIRLADIDGTGTTDIIYLHRDGVRLYFNQSGNAWGAPRVLKVFPRVHELASITPADLLGNGTACLVWSSSLPGEAARPMRYVRLMGDHKPHLLVRTVNNLGAETLVQYAPSTKSTWRTSCLESRGSRGSPSRCTWSSVSRLMITSGAAASLAATPTTTATSTDRSASFGASAWSSNGTRKPSMH